MKLLTRAFLFSNILCMILHLFLHDHGMNSSYKYHSVDGMLCTGFSSAYIIICFVCSNQDALMEVFLLYSNSDMKFKLQTESWLTTDTGMSKHMNVMILLVYHTIQYSLWLSTWVFSILPFHFQYCVSPAI